MKRPINVRFFNANCHNCVSRFEDRGVSYCRKAPDNGEPWHDLTEGDAVSLESVTCDSWELEI